ncbi:hypothetical protein PAE9249_05122 [Paenibacillus sp. CECT 9249]|uniref:discoidin domain-containing protein n=1 Tax=Paenibacillus sp. CECT 9249 TaxID=2845385 RepID=UPI001E480FBD|nr:discoidin domain-containing protein [Paenibacillus sp. CECT 9249]CAH0122550.1 hypothetical protein PAE9249_05122 [Paenibacillus sp. CECT 9249]
MPIMKGNAIPRMTSNNSPSGKVLASGTRGDQWEPFSSFDRNGNSYWEVEGTKHWISYEFPTPKYIYKYSITACKYEKEAPKDWTFEGSIDGLKWEILDSVKNSVNWIKGERREFEVSTLSPNKIYRVNIASANSSSYIGIAEIEMMEVIYEKKTLILHDSIYKYYTKEKWVSLGSSVTEQAYLTYGMDNALIGLIPENAWSLLRGEIEICHFCEDNNIEKTVFTIETEPFTLAEEFKNKEIKIIEYTDDPNQTESVISIETEPFTFYDEFGDSVDVLYYTDDLSKESAELEIQANYSPLDEIEGNFDIVTWTDNDQEDIEMIASVNALPIGQLVLNQENILYYGDIQSFVAEQVPTTYRQGIVRYVVSFDGGSTWQTFRKRDGWCYC